MTSSPSESNLTNMDDVNQVLTNISRDLDHVDFSQVRSMIATKGWNNTAKILGYDVSQYQNLILAGRMSIHHINSIVPSSVSEYIEVLKERFSPPVMKYMLDNVQVLQEMVDSRKDYDLNHDFFSAQSLIRTYLSRPKAGQPICESPRHLLMRISVALHYDESFDDVKQMFNDLCDQLYVPASPTIFNAGFKSGRGENQDRGQLASCFLMTVDDTTESILYRGAGDMGLIAKYNGGVGLDVSRLRHSEIGSSGDSNGLVPWLYMYNSVIRAIIAGGKRRAAATIFCRPHHVDIYEFCEMSLKTGDHYRRAHDVNFAVWFPWLFWDRVKNDEDWTLFCPAKTPDLNECWGFEWEQNYIKYEQDPSIPSNARRTVKARNLLEHMTACQRKSGMPYIMHADACNGKSNQQHLGYIRQSNLCIEIVQFTSEDEIAVCNLSNISLKAFVKKPWSRFKSDIKDGDQLYDVFDFNKLGQVTARVVKNLNKCIDKTYYPLKEAKTSNTRHRPIGIGVSGFAEMLYELDLPFSDPNDPSKPHPITKLLNKMIFSCMYWNGLAQSVNMAIKDGQYETFKGSPASKGKLQFDLWADEYQKLLEKGRINSDIRKKDDDEPIAPKQWNSNSFAMCNSTVIEPTWDSLKTFIKIFGLRNSLLLALMPTATSAQPLRNTESVEAPQSCIYSRKVMNGAYPVVNPKLVEDLQSIGAWNRSTVDLIQASNGSISKLDQFVAENAGRYPLFKNNVESINRLRHLQHKYKTMWELSMKVFLQMAADRGRYIDQSQSTNIYLHDPTDAQLIAIHLYTHHLGLKTGMYYLRQGAAMEPIKFTVDPKIIDYVSNLNIDQSVETPKNKSTKTINKNSSVNTFNNKSNRNSNKIGSRNIVCNDEICLSCS